MTLTGLANALNALDVDWSNAWPYRATTPTPHLRRSSMVASISCVLDDIQSGASHQKPCSFRLSLAYGNSAPTHSREIDVFADLPAKSSVPMVLASCFSILLLAIATTVIAIASGQSRLAHTQALTPQQKLARDIFKELIEINTVSETGDTDQPPTPWPHDCGQPAMQGRICRFSSLRRASATSLPGWHGGQQTDPAVSSHRRGSC